MKIWHIRAYNPRLVHPRQHDGVITIGSELNYYGSKFPKDVQYAIAICSPHDRFVRKIGNELIRSRIESQLPSSEDSGL